MARRWLAEGGGTEPAGLVLGGLMTLIFLSIFTLAEYPMNWIDDHTAALADWVKASMSPGDLRDLITDGGIAGVGGVIIFLPQILILFFFISVLWRFTMLLKTKI